MKRFLKCFLVLVVCVCACLGFVGCDDLKWSKVTNDTTGVVSNGGVAVYHDGWLYFINGTKTNNEANNTGTTIQAAIYRVKTDDEGNILYKETEVGEKTSSESDDEEETKEFLQIERVVGSLVGFDEGSIYIFGDYLYYATPCKDKNKDGTMLTGKTEFRRYDLVNKNDQFIYTTQASDDTITYSYYKQGEALNLVVYEQTSAILTSLKLDSEVTQNFKKTDVRSVVMSENFGESVSGTITDNYIYYTLNYDENSTILRGVRVYRVLPDGTGEKKISEGSSVTLIAIRAGHLIYSKDSIVYSEIITESTEQILFTAQNVVCYTSYENIIFLEDSGRVSALVYDNTTLRFISWKNGSLTYDNIYEFDADTDISFIGVDGDYVVYLNSNLVYKIKYQNVAEGEENYPIKLSTTTINEASELMAPEIVNGYIYGFNTDSSAKVTYLYRINIQTPKELGETEEDGTDKEVGAAEFIGVKE